MHFVRRISSCHFRQHTSHKDMLRTCSCSLVYATDNLSPTWHICCECAEYQRGSCGGALLRIAMWRYMWSFDLTRVRWSVNPCVVHLLSPGTTFKWTWRRIYMGTGQYPRRSCCHVSNLVIMFLGRSVYQFNYWPHLVKRPHFVVLRVRYWGGKSLCCDQRPQTAISSAAQQRGLRDEHIQKSKI